MAIETDTNAIIERIKSEILADVKAGTVPETVASFSELHDYVDANCYGGMEEIYDNFTEGSDGSDESMTAALNRVSEIMNPAIDAVDAWIKAGGVKNV